MICDPKSISATLEVKATAIITPNLFPFLCILGEPSQSVYDIFIGIKEFGSVDLKGTLQVKFTQAIELAFLHKTLLVRVGLGHKRLFLHVYFADC